MAKTLTNRNAKGALALASIHAVYNCVQDGEAKALVWPSEGSFTSVDTFKSEAGEMPLLLDHWTASAIVAIYEAVQPDQKNKLARMLKGSRGQFMKVAMFALSKVKGS